MIQGYATEDGRLKPVETPIGAIDRLVWIDISDPTDAEETAVETALGIDVPTRAEMEEIEDSSRLYTEDGAAFMTANLPSRTDTETPVLAPVTFILAGARLITVRYHEPKAFRTLAARAERVAMGCVDGATVLLSLLETVIDRLADILEKIGRDIEQLSRTIFRPVKKPGRGPDYQSVLQELGRHGDLVANVTDSLVTLERLVVFLTASAGRGVNKDGRLRIKTLGRDTRFLSDHASRAFAEADVPARRHARHDLDRAERDHQDLLGGGGGVPAADADRLDLRHELRRDPGVALGGRLPVRARPDGAVRGAVVPVLQDPGLALEL